ncbi:MAG: PepSY domain-containing protein [Cellvibrionaceae bacterium]|nr:PepSY domain-containing protein [Cellvibrionaceae bacterium]
MKFPILFVLLLSAALNQNALAAQSTVHLAKHSKPDHWSQQTLPCACSNEAAAQLLQLASKGISERQAAAIAKKAYGGSVINVSLNDNVYRVKLLKGGKVRIVKIDAKSGKIL